MEIQPFRSLLASPFISRRLFDREPADQNPSLSQKLFRPADRNPVKFDPKKDDAVELEPLKRRSDDVSNHKHDDEGGLLRKLAKRSLKGVEKLGDELEHAAFQQFKSHLRELQQIAKDFGVDESDFREFIKSQLSALGIKDNRPLTNERGNVADSVSEGSFAAVFASASSLQASQSGSALSIDAAVREFGSIAFDGELKTKDGGSVHLTAAFEFDLSAEIEVGVNGSGISIPGAKASGDEDARNNSGEFDYGEVVGGLLARLKEFELRLRPPGKGRGGREDHENVDRTQLDEQLAVNKSPNEPTDASPRLAGIAYNYQAERFQFDYFRLTASDGANTKSLEAYRAISQSLSTSFTAVIV